MKRKKASQDEINLIQNPVNVFTCSCGNCEDSPFDKFKKHLVDFHNLQEGQFKGTKQMIMHMDGDYWYSYSYQWELESGLKFQQFIKQARSQDDPMRY